MLILLILSKGDSNLKKLLVVTLSVLILLSSKSAISFQADNQHCETYHNQRIQAYGSMQRLKYSWYAPENGKFKMAIDITENECPVNEPGRVFWVGIFRNDKKVAVRNVCYSRRYEIGSSRPKVVSVAKYEFATIPVAVSDYIVVRVGSRYPAAYDISLGMETQCDKLPAFRPTPIKLPSAPMTIN